MVFVVIARQVWQTDNTFVRDRLRKYSIYSFRLFNPENDRFAYDESDMNAKLPRIRELCGPAVLC